MASYRKNHNRAREETLTPRQPHQIIAPLSSSRRWSCESDALNCLFLTLLLSWWALTICGASLLMVERFCAAKPFLVRHASSLKVMSRDAGAPVRAWQVVPVLARREAGGDRRKETARHEPEDNLEQGRLHPKTYVTENHLLVGAGDNIQFLRSCSLLSTQSLCAIFEWLTSSLHHLR